jgi:hypothetical protein
MPCNPALMTVEKSVSLGIRLNTSLLNELPVAGDADCL